MRYILDRLEEGWAVCQKEDKSIINIPLNQLSPEVLSQLKEGDILEETDQGLVIDSQATSLRREQMRRKLMDLFQ